MRGRLGKLTKAKAMVAQIRKQEEANRLSRVPGSGSTKWPPCWSVPARKKFCRVIPRCDPSIWTWRSFMPRPIPVEVGRPDTRGMGDRLRFLIDECLHTSLTRIADEAGFLGITVYVQNGGALEHAQQMAVHQSPVQRGDPTIGPTIIFRSTNSKGSNSKVTDTLPSSRSSDGG
jgi:hypothetical protein